MRYNLPVEELEDIANIEVGEALRRTRIHYGKSLEDIETSLRIRACQIDAIEKGDVAELPGRVYAIGFVRSYAEYLGLDGAKVVRLFKAQYMDGVSGSSLSFPIPASDTRAPAVWLVVLCLIVAFLASRSFQTDNRAERLLVTAVDNVPDDIRDHVEQSILSTHVEVQDKIRDVVMQEQGDVEGARVSSPKGIVLNMIADSWVEIKNEDGDVIVSNILKKGDQYFVPDSSDLNMSLGNAANVEVIVDGRALKPLGKKGDVRRDIPLNIKYLRTLEFKDVEDMSLDRIED